MMSRAKVLLGVGFTSLVFLVLPSLALAGGPDVDPAGDRFVAEQGTFMLSAEGTVPIVCTGPNHLWGTFDEGSNTEGEINLDYTNCHPLGFSVACHTAGSPLTNTIGISGVRFKTVYATEGKSRPGLMLTVPGNVIFPGIQITCGGVYELKGSVIGTITLPKCSETLTTASLSFSATGYKQEHTQITGTGTSYFLQEKVGGVWKPAGLTLSTSLLFYEKMTLTCI